MKKRISLVLALLLTLLVASTFYLISLSSQQGAHQTAVIERVIDGDTFVTDDGTTIRLLNINTPEKSEPESVKAIEFVKQYEGQTVELEVTGTEKYGRTLARVYTPEYLNLQLVREGLARKFLVDPSEIEEFASAEQEAIENERGIWKKSPYFECITTTIDTRDEEVLIQNTCPEMNLRGWTARDESRKEYKFGSVEVGRVTLHTKSGDNNATDIFWGSNQNVWNNDRDTLYIFDAEGNIAHYHPYGY